jgi:hypothetical protein
VCSASLSILPLTGLSARGDLSHSRSLPRDPIFFRPRSRVFLSPQPLSAHLYPFHSTTQLVATPIEPPSLMPVSRRLPISLHDGMDASLSYCSSFLSRHPIEAAPSGRIWPHSDQEGCIRNLRELPPSLPTQHSSAGPTSPALHSPRAQFQELLVP